LFYGSLVDNQAVKFDAPDCGREVASGRLRSGLRRLKPSRMEKGLVE